MWTLTQLLLLNMRKRQNELKKDDSNCTPQPWIYSAGPRFWQGFLHAPVLRCLVRLTALCAQAAAWVMSSCSRALQDTRQQALRVCHHHTISSYRSEIPIISALASRIVACSLCIVATFPLGQTHPYSDSLPLSSSTRAAAWKATATFREELKCLASR